MRCRLVRAIIFSCFPIVFFIAGAQAAPRELPDFTRLVGKHAQAVVNISTTQRLKRANVAPGLDEPSDEPPFNDFFRRYFDEMPDNFDANSLGSGFIISTDGYILTCAHVVEDASEILVRLADRRELNARLVGSDRRSDVALLKIDATALPTVTIGNPQRLQVGEWVLAIGSPFGFDSSATSGIVSAKGRTLPSENYIAFIQSDVAINPGNSGGPLFNLKGEVVGVNSQIYSRTGGFMGLSFAIPIDAAMNIGAQLKNQGKVKRGWLGISLQEVSRALAMAYGLNKPRGALIADILPNGPASKSDLRSGDIVLEYEGRPIDRSTELPPLVGLSPPGMRVHVTIFRREQGIQNLVVALGELKEEAAERPAPRGRAVSGNRLGLVLGELTTNQRRSLDTDYGVSVDNLEDGPARSAGLRPGDVIVEVDGRRVTGVISFNRLLTTAAPDKPVVLRVRRGGVSSYIALRAGG